MEYVYAAMLLHSAGKKITEDNVKKVLEGAGTNVDEARVKALVSALEGVNIEEVMKQPVAMPAVATPVAKEEKVEKKEKAKEEEEKGAETATEGLASLFG